MLIEPVKNLPKIREGLGYAVRVGDAHTWRLQASHREAHGDAVIVIGGDGGALGDPAMDD